MRHLLTIERVAFASLFFAAGTASIFRLQFYFPSLDSAWFVLHHYLGPVLLPAIVLPAVLFVKVRARTWAKAVFLLRLRGVGAFALIVYLHFNFKLWAQLINPKLFDDVYMGIDEKFRSVVNCAFALSVFYRSGLIYFPHAYHQIFISMFVLSFFVHGMQSDRLGFDRLLLAVALVLALGGVSYFVAPAFGPFVFEAGDSPAAGAIQAVMASFQQGFRESRGADYDSTYFVSALAAMPSLHLAHALVFLWFALRHARWLGVIYMVPVSFIAVEAVAARWHYLIDLPAGLIIALVGIFLANRLILPQADSP